MGRTIPSFRIASKMEYAEWKNFQRALPKADRKLFDNMFSISVLHKVFGIKENLRAKTRRRRYDRTG
jgi:hypothetical protein